MILRVRGLARGATLVAVVSLMWTSVGSAEARTMRGRVHHAPQLRVKPGLRVSVITYQDGSTELEVLADGPAASRRAHH